jgi:hypothetical protein
MYTRLAEIWEGYTKSYWAGLSGNWRLALAAIMVWLVASVLPWIALPALAWRYFTLVQAGAAVPLLDLAALCLAGIAVFIQFGISGHFARSFCGLSRLWGLAHPLGFIMLAAIMINSGLTWTVGGGPRWKGRVYSGLSTSPPLRAAPRPFL